MNTLLTLLMMLVSVKSFAWEVKYEDKYLIGVENNGFFVRSATALKWAEEESPLLEKKIANQLNRALRHNGYQNVYQYFNLIQDSYYYEGFTSGVPSFSKGFAGVAQIYLEPRDPSVEIVIVNENLNMAEDRLLERLDQIKKEVKKRYGKNILFFIGQPTIADKRRCGGFLFFSRNYCGIAQIKFTLLN